MKKRISNLFLFCALLCVFLTSCKTAILNETNFESNISSSQTIGESSAHSLSESPQNSQPNSSAILNSSQASSQKVSSTKPTSSASAEVSRSITETGKYGAKDDVSKYISIYHKLPSNYITKAEAEKLGWESSKGNLWAVTDKKSIGGDIFGNREGLLPSKNGRKYYECDINYNGGFRGAERIVFSDDGLIFYTADHYATFTQLNH